MKNKKIDKEFEVKVLDFDLEKIIKKLGELGFKEDHEILLKRWVLDFSSEEAAEWFRLRTDGIRSFLAYKKKLKKNFEKGEIGKTEETEVEVKDFETTYKILGKFPFNRRFYQENKRHLFKKGEVEVSIDSWPLIKPYLEIESTNKKKVLEMLNLLGLSDKNVGDMDITVIYKNQGFNLHLYKELRFT